MFIKKVVAYYRVSTPRQGETGFGLEAQRKSVSQFASSNSIEVVREFTEVESGKNNNRPLLKEALAYCQKCKAILIIAKLDRLGRNVAFISALMESKVEFVAVDNPHATKVVLHVLAAFAEHEREMISIRTKEALQAAKKRGIKLGVYSAVLAEQNKKMANEFAIKMQPIIKKLNRKGIKSTRKIAIALNQMKVPTFRKQRWHSNSVFLLLQRIKKINN